MIYESKKLKLILVGNPNVGKSVFFNALTGSYVDVSNFPGTTVDITIGTFEKYQVIDTPGVYGISSFNDEESVTRDSIVEADVILNVIDAVHLERDLFLTQQIIDMGKPTVIALNMMDEVKKNHIHIDVNQLSKLLGIPVIGTEATKGIGITEIKNAIRRGGCIGLKVHEIDQQIQSILPMVDSTWDALLLLEEDERITGHYRLGKKYACREQLYTLRRKYVNKIINEVYIRISDKNSILSTIGSLMLKPLIGIPILGFLLYLIYLVIGVIVAQHIVDFTEKILMGTYYFDFIMGITKGFLNPDHFAGNLLIGEFGILTMVPIYLLGLLLPLVIAFYFLMSLLEDSGFLPRIAVLVDRSLNFFGLNGRAVIPIILGFGCVTMALVTTRILGSNRERLIATMLLCVAIPCSAQFGILMSIATTLKLSYLILYAMSILLVFIILGVLLNLFLPGQSTELLIDIPPVRIPKLINVLKKTALKSKLFLMDAGPMFLLGAAIISILSYTDGLTLISQWFYPVTVNFLNLPMETTNVFIMGIIRRDFGAAGLSTLVAQGILSAPQTVVALIVITLFVPCIASLMILFKERKLLDALMIWFSSFIIAFLVGGLVSRIII